MRNVGDMGEGFFKLWCSTVGLTANQSTKDQYGWDYIVEFPFSLNPSPHEVHKSALECRVQVKATDHSKRKLQVSLSVLKRLATALTPSFFIFIEFNKKNDPENAYLVHLDDSLIFKILKRVHKEEQTKREAKLNKKTMQISYDDSHKLTQLGGEGLKKALLEHIGTDLAEYITKKKEYLEKSGYEEDRNEIRFKTVGEDSISDFIDMTLGIENKVEVFDILGFETRFGIKTSIPKLNSDKATIKIMDKKPNYVGHVKFKADEFSQGLKFDADLFSSSLIKFIPDSQKKIRIVCSIFEIHYFPLNNSVDIKFHFNNSTRFEIEQLQKVLRLLDLFYTSKLVYWELVFSGIDKIKIKSKRAEIPESFSRKVELKALECAKRLFAFFEVTEPIIITIDELSTYADLMCDLSAIVDRADKLDSLKVTFSLGTSEKLEENKDEAVIIRLKVAIGNHIYGALFLIFGKSKKIENEKFSVESNNYLIRRQVLLPVEDFPSEDLWQSEIDGLVEKYDNDYNVIYPPRVSNTDK